MIKRKKDSLIKTLDEFLSLSGTETNETFERVKKLIRLSTVVKDFRPYVTEDRQTVTVQINVELPDIKYVKIAKNHKTGKLKKITAQAKSKELYISYFGEEPDKENSTTCQRLYENGGREMICRIMGGLDCDLVDKILFGPIEEIAIGNSIEFIERDISEIRHLKCTDTQKKRLIDARLGQGNYRKGLIEIWGACSLTNCATQELLIASHIKPWRCSSHKERLDSFNGFLLVATIDKAFDSGLISFNDDGLILISSQFDEYQKIGIYTDMRIELKQKNLPYLAYHRQHIYRG